MEIGDIVAPNKQGVYLRSGSEVWTEGVVCSVDPFIMVSKDTTMRWGAQQIEDYCTVGKAPIEMLQKCMMRLEPSEKALAPFVPDKEVVFATVKKNNTIIAYYRGMHVGTVVEGDEASVIALMDKFSDKLLERAQNNFKEELIKQVPSIALTIQHAVNKQIARRKSSSFFERMFG